MRDAFFIQSTNLEQPHFVPAGNNTENPNKPGQKKSTCQ